MSFHVWGTFQRNNRYRKFSNSGQPKNHGLGSLSTNSVNGKINNELISLVRLCQSVRTTTAQGQQILVVSGDVWLIHTSLNCVSWLVNRTNLMVTKQKKKKKKTECSFPTKKSKRSNKKNIYFFKSLKVMFEIVAADIRDLDFINVFSCV